MELLLHSELLRQLDYNPLNGFLRWKILKPGVTIGSIAGSKMNGYIQIVINKIPYLAHRLAWFFYYGYWPEKEIDHRDQIRYHNWILNLREASSQCNQRNKGNPKNNTSGIKGVYRNKEKWIVQIGVDNKVKTLGRYSHFDNAVCARLAGEQCVNWAGCNSNSPAFQYVRKHIQNKHKLLDGGF